MHVFRILLSLVVIASGGCASEVERDQRKADDLARRWPELVRLTHAARQAQHTGVCNIHHIRMQRKAVPIDPGCITAETLWNPYYTASLRGFPHAEESAWLPGYDIYRARYERRRKYICSECKGAQKQWALHHPNDSDAQFVLKH